MISKEVLEKLEYIKVVSLIEKYCVTDPGKSFTMSLLPLNDVHTIIKTGRQVNEAKEILIRNDIPPLDYLPDLSETLSRSRIEGTVLTTRQILDILKLAEISRKLFQFLKPNDNKYSYLSDIYEKLFVDKVFEHFIGKIFTENGELRDDASPKLKEIRINIREKEAGLQKLVQKMLKQLSDSYLVQEEYITLRDGRIVLPVKAEHKRHVRGFVHSESSTGQTVYIEPEATLELNNEILSLGFAEKREIEKILKGLTERIGQHYLDLKTSLFAVSEIDSIFARGKYSIEIIGSHPSYDENKQFELIEARHPLLLKRIGHANTIPMNLNMNNINVILITGPNAGGKTVTLKTTGLLVCLALAGIPIPCHPDSNFYCFENVLVDIGDAQSIEDDLSTFSSHLKNIRKIIDKANEKSLVLLDEIGTGTDPAEGAALATAVLVLLCNKGAKVLSTTHHGSLKVFANQTDKFQNASMQFDSEHLRPTYIFNQGMPGSSYAFEVANRIGFDDQFIDLAKNYLDTDKTKIEDFLVSLENKSQDMKEQLDKYERENVRLKGLANLYQNKIEKLENQKKEILADLRVKADLYLMDINKKIENTVKNIRESGARKEIVKEEKKKIEEIKSETSKIFKKEIHESGFEKTVLNVGDYASVRDTNSVGIIFELNKEKDKAVLNVGTLKIKTKYSELVPAKKSEIEKPFNNKYDIDQNEVSYRLDLRGMRGEEAEFEILKFLDAALMNGTDRVEILHGKGTGILKQITHTTLKKYPSVKNYYYANIEFGGEGITIVEFK